MALNEISIPIDQRSAARLTVGLSGRGNALISSAAGHVEVEPEAVQELLEALSVAFAAGRRVSQRKGGTREVGNRAHNGRLR